MKIRVFSNMCNGVYRIVMNTEDWSCGDIELMAQYGEPQIDVGLIDDGSSSFGHAPGSHGHEYVRIMHGFPYSRGFDSRDYGGSVDDAVSAGDSWKNAVKDRIATAVNELRTGASPLPLPNEEVEVI